MHMQVCTRFSAFSVHHTCKCIIDWTHVSVCYLGKWGTCNIFMKSIQYIYRLSVYSYMCLIAGHATCICNMYIAFGGGYELTCTPTLGMYPEWPTLS